MDFCRFDSQKCRKCEECQGFSPRKDNELCCVSCKCFKNLHTPRTTSSAISIAEIIGDLAVVVKPDSVIDDGFTWLPKGLKLEEISEYFSGFCEDDIPKIGTSGEFKRIQRLMHQIPIQDIDPKHCDSVKTRDEREVFLKFKSEMITKFSVASIARLDSEYTCEECKLVVGVGAIGVVVNVGTQTAYWHPGCFRCRKCSDLLADLAYCRIGFSIYCVRHFNDNLRSRCYTCDENICQTNFISSMNNHWHVHHLTCWSCDKKLAGNKLIMKDDRTYCLGCFEQKFCHECEKCKIKIGADMKDIAYQNKHWHGTCFYCFKCDKSLIGLPFVFHAQSLCCTECYNEHFAPRCFKCSKIFRPGAKKLSYKGNEYHEGCFVCEFCENPIVSASFLIKENKVCCRPCYEKIFATKCTKCEQIIETGGVVFREQPFHQECFCCKQCGCNLSKTKFLTHTNEAYCNDCYSQLFCKRCFACSAPITDEGGAKYIHFEDKNWHSHCFVCCKCRISLANRTFLVEGIDIICPKCAY